MRKDLHALRNRVYTGSDQTFGTFHFHDAHTAGTNLIDLFQKAESRNVDVCHACCFQDGNAFRHLVINIVDLDINISHFSLLLSQTTSTASCLHAEIQVPQRMQISGLMT